MLNGAGRGLVNNLAVMSDVAPGYAPAGEALVAVSVLGGGTSGAEAMEKSIRSELTEWFGSQVRDWRRLRTYTVPRALPVRWPLVNEGPKTVRPGVWLAGDWQGSASIHGAMASGESVATAIISRA